MWQHNVWCVCVVLCVERYVGMLAVQDYYLPTVVCVTVHQGRVLRTSCVPEKVGVNKKYLNKNNILINKASSKRK